MEYKIAVYHVAVGMDNYFMKWCSLCIFFILYNLFAYQWISFSSILYSLFKSQLFLWVMPLEFISPEGERCICCYLILLKTFHSLLDLIIHSNHSSTLGRNDWQQLKMETTNKQRYWWHLPHQESLNRKESMSDQRSITFLCWIFCDVKTFYAFIDPCFALYQKQSTATTQNTQ